MTTAFIIFLILTILILVRLVFIFRDQATSARTNVNYLETYNAELLAANRDVVNIIEGVRLASAELVKRIKDHVHFSTGHSVETDVLEDLTIGLFKAHSSFDIRIPSPDNFSRVGICIADGQKVTLNEALKYAVQIDIQANQIEHHVSDLVRLCRLDSKHEISRWFVDSFSRIARLYGEENYRGAIRDIRNLLSAWEATGSLFSSVSMAILHSTENLKITQLRDQPSEEWIAHAYPLKRCEITIQGTKHSSLESMISQLNEIAARLSNGDESGKHHDDDFGYTFTVSESRKSVFAENSEVR